MNDNTQDDPRQEFHPAHRRRNYRTQPNSSSSYRKTHPVTSMRERKDSSQILWSPSSNQATPRHRQKRISTSSARKTFNLRLLSSSSSFISPLLLMSMVTMMSTVAATTKAETAAGSIHWPPSYDFLQRRGQNQEEEGKHDFEFRKMEDESIVEEDLAQPQPQLKHKSWSLEAGMKPEPRFLQQNQHQLSSSRSLRNFLSLVENPQKTRTTTSKLDETENGDQVQREIHKMSKIKTRAKNHEEISAGIGQDSLGTVIKNPSNGAVGVILKNKVPVDKNENDEVPWKAEAEKDDSHHNFQLSELRDDPPADTTVFSLLPDVGANWEPTTDREGNEYDRNGSSFYYDRKTKEYFPGTRGDEFSRLVVQPQRSVEDRSAPLTRVIHSMTNHPSSIGEGMGTTDSGQEAQPPKYEEYKALNTHASSVGVPSALENSYFLTTIRQRQGGLKGEGTTRNPATTIIHHNKNHRQLLRSEIPVQPESSELVVDTDSNILTAANRTKTSTIATAGLNHPNVYIQHSNNLPPGHQAAAVPDELAVTIAQSLVSSGTPPRKLHTPSRYNPKLQSHREDADRWAAGLNEMMVPQMMWSTTTKPLSPVTSTAASGNAIEPVTLFRGIYRGGRRPLSKKKKSWEVINGKHRIVPEKSITNQNPMKVPPSSAGRVSDDHPFSSPPASKMTPHDNSRIDIMRLNMNQILKSIRKHRKVLKQEESAVKKESSRSRNRSRFGNGNGGAEEHSVSVGSVMGSSPVPSSPQHGDAISALELSSRGARKMSSTGEIARNQKHREPSLRLTGGDQWRPSGAQQNLMDSDEQPERHRISSHEDFIETLRSELSSSGERSPTENAERGPGDHTGSEIPIIPVKDWKILSPAQPLLPVRSLNPSAKFQRSYSSYDHNRNNGIGKVIEGGNSVMSQSLNHAQQVQRNTVEELEAVPPAPSNFGVQELENSRPPPDLLLSYNQLQGSGAGAKLAVNEGATGKIEQQKSGAAWNNTNQTLLGDISDLDDGSASPEQELQISRLLSAGGAANESSEANYWATAQFASSNNGSSSHQFHPGANNHGSVWNNNQTTHVSPEVLWNETFAQQQHTRLEEPGEHSGLPDSISDLEPTTENGADSQNVDDFWNDDNNSNNNSNKVYDPIVVRSGQQQEQRSGLVESGGRLSSLNSLSNRTNPDYDYYFTGAAAATSNNNELQNVTTDSFFDTNNTWYYSSTVPNIDIPPPLPPKLEEVVEPADQVFAAVDVDGNQLLSMKKSSSSLPVFKQTNSQAQARELEQEPESNDPIPVVVVGSGGDRGGEQQDYSQNTNNHSHVENHQNHQNSFNNQSWMLMNGSLISNNSNSNNPNNDGASPIQNQSNGAAAMDPNSNTAAARIEYAADLDQQSNQSMGEVEDLRNQFSSTPEDRAAGGLNGWDQFTTASIDDSLNSINFFSNNKSSNNNDSIIDFIDPSLPILPVRQYGETNNNSDNIRGNSSSLVYPESSNVGLIDNNTLLLSDKFVGPDTDSTNRFLTVGNQSQLEGQTVGNNMADNIDNNDEIGSIQSNPGDQIQSNNSNIELDLNGGDHQEDRIQTLDEPSGSASTTDQQQSDESILSQNTNNLTNRFNQESPSVILNGTTGDSNPNDGDPFGGETPNERFESGSNPDILYPENGRGQGGGEGGGPSPFSSFGDSNPPFDNGEDENEDLFPGFSGGTNDLDDDGDRLTPPSAIDPNQPTIFPVPRGPNGINSVRPGTGFDNRTNNSGGACEDREPLWICEDWRRSQYCSLPKHHVVPEYYCRRTCGRCGQPEQQACEDDQWTYYCEDWKRKGWCADRSHTLNIYCRKTCGFC